MRLLVVILALTCTTCHALDITTTSGATYTNAAVTRTEPDGITIKHRRGVTKLFFPELPQDVQTQYGYNPAAAQEYRNKVAEYISRTPVPAPYTPTPAAQPQIVSEADQIRRQIAQLEYELAHPQADTSGRMGQPVSGKMGGGVNMTPSQRKQAAANDIAIKQGQLRELREQLSDALMAEQRYATGQTDPGAEEMRRQLKKMRKEIERVDAQAFNAEQDAKKASWDAAEASQDAHNAANTAKRATEDAVRDVKRDAELGLYPFSRTHDAK